MKDIFLLIRQRKTFYLTVPILTVLITICGSFYNIFNATQYYRENIAVDTLNEEKLSLLAVQSVGIFTRGADDGGQLMNHFVQNDTYMCYTALTFLIAIVLISGYWGMTDVKTKEFLATYPVKKVSLAMYPYVATFGILLINAVISLAIHLLMLTFYNNQIIDLAVKFPGILGGVVPTDLVLTANISFLKQFGIVLLYLIAILTFDALFVVLFRNEIVGISIGFFLYNSFGFGYVQCFDVARRVLNRIEFFMQPYQLFGINEWTETGVQNKMYISVIVTLVIGIVVMIALMILQGKFRELSKGKMVYSNILQIVLLVISGYFVFSFLHDVILVFPFTSDWIIPIALLFTIPIMVAEFYFLYGKKGRIYKVSVKELHVWKNPVLQKILPLYWMIEGVVLCVVLSFGAYLHRTLEYFNKAMANPQNYDVIGKEEHLKSIFWEDECATVFIIGGFCVKVLMMLAERKKTAREFFETLPVKRKKVFVTNYLMDFAFVAIPTVLLTLIKSVYLLLFSEDAAVADLCQKLLGQQWVYCFSILCVGLAMTGFLHLIDAWVVNGGFKIIFAVTGIACSAMVLAYMSDFFGVYWLLLLLLDAFVSASEYCFMSGIFYLVIGVITTVLAAYFYERRDKAKEIFYYGFVKYIFAIILSLTYLLFVGTGYMFENAFLLFLVAIVGTVLTFVFTLYYCTPDRKLIFKIKKESV